MFGLKSHKSPEAEPSVSAESKEAGLPLVSREYGSSLEVAGEAEQQARKERLKDMAGPMGIISTADAQQVSNEVRSAGDVTAIPVTDNSHESTVEVRTGENN